MPCGSSKNRRFGATHRLHPQGNESPESSQLAARTRPTADGEESPTTAPPRPSPSVAMQTSWSHSFLCGDENRQLTHSRPSSCLYMFPRLYCDIYRLLSSRKAKVFPRIRTVSGDLCLVRLGIL
jgi:hypothetical protein